MSSSPDAVKVPVTSQKGGDPTESKAVAKEGTTSSASLLDTDGDLAPAFHLALARIFLRFSSSAQKLGLKLDSADAPALDVQLNKLKKVAMEDEELDAFARATNGEVLSNESKDEIKEYLDCDDQARITVRFVPFHNTMPSSLCEKGELILLTLILPAMIHRAVFGILRNVSFADRQRCGRDVEGLESARLVSFFLFIFFLLPFLLIS